MNNTRICQVCGIEKDNSNFYIHNGYFNKTCKKCCIQINRERQQKKKLEKIKSGDIGIIELNRQLVKTQCKKCTACLEIKGMESYTASKEGLGGKYSRCIACVKISNKERVSSPEYKLKARLYNLKKTYQLDKEQYTNLYKQQRYKCAICLKKVTPFEPDDSCVDHCHKTGVVRGILCRSCNSALGRFRDSEIILKRAIRYLKGGENE